MENWRIQTEVPEGMWCLLSVINALTEAHTEDSTTTAFLPSVGWEFIQW